MNNIHPTAIVSPSVKLGKDVLVGAYSVIDGNVTIGDGTAIHSHVRISGNTKIGSNCQIFPFASLGLAPQDHHYAGEETFLEIGDDNTIREYVTFSPGTTRGGGVTRIGNHNLFMISSHVGHDATVGSHCTIANNVPIAGHVIIEDYVVIGGNAAIHQFVRVGKHSMVGGLSGLKTDLIPFSLTVNAFSRSGVEILGSNIVGLKRRGFSREDILIINDVFKMLALHSGTLADKLASIEAMYVANHSPHVFDIITFMKDSHTRVNSRGISSFARKSDEHHDE